MKFFSDLKLGVRILSGFFIVAIIAAAIGIMGIININTVNSNDTKLYEKITVPLSQLYNITDSFEKIRIAIRDIVLSNNQKDIADYEVKYNASRADLDKYFLEFQQTLLTADGIAVKDKLTTAINDYGKIGNQIISLAKADKPAEALILMRSDGVKTSNVVEEYISTLDTMKVDLAKTTSSDNSSTSRNATNLMLGLIIFGVAMAVALGILISKSITNPIKKLVEYSDRLATGDIDIEINNNSKDEIGILMLAFGKMVQNIKEQTAAVEKISSGDLNISLKVKSEKDALGKSLLSMVETIKAILAETSKLIKATQEGQLDTRGNAAMFNGGWGELVGGVNKLIDAFVGPINVTAEYVDRISKGDIPPKITDKYNGDFNEIKNNLNNCIDVMSGLLAETNMLIKATQEGQLDTRGNAGSFNGGWGELVGGVNKLIDAFVGPINVTAEYVDRISKGDIPPKITDKYNGDFNEIKNNLNNCIDVMNGLLAETNKLIKATQEGELATRGNASMFNGGWGQLVMGINDLITAFVKPINVTSDYVDKISKGNIPSKITDTYNGDFNIIKNNLNLCIDSINLLVVDSASLVDAAVAGKLSVRADVTKHSGDFRKIVEGVNKTLDAVIEPVKEASDVLKEMANGNLKVHVKGDYKGDHADIKNALNDTIDSLASYVKEISEVLEEMSNSNLDLGIKSEYKGDFLQIKEALNLIIQSFNEVFSEINNAADQVSSGSTQVSDGSQALSQGTTEQASSIEELTASITEVASQTKQNALNAGQANELALNAKDGAAQGNSHMKEMLKSMDEINQSSSNISKIIKVIDDIAFQTNILALNAAVEAARAGQHGKGFAVVAEEVRNLAARSANAAKETTDLIEGSIKKVELGTKIANNTAEALDQIVEGVSKAANLVGQIATASNEQASAISQINKGIEQVSEVVQTNSATAEESAAASEELSSQASMLKSMIGKFILKKNSGTSYGNMDNGNERKKSFYNAQSVSTKVKPKISLNEREYGKY